jgi:hypothetical protein
LVLGLTALVPDLRRGLRWPLLVYGLVGLTAVLGTLARYHTGIAGVVGAFELVAMAALLVAAFGVRSGSAWVTGLLIGAAGCWLLAHFSAWRLILHPLAIFTAGGLDLVAKVVGVPVLCLAMALAGRAEQSEKA